MLETFPWRWKVENYEIQITLSVYEISRIVSWRIKYIEQSDVIE
jgi:hypothetical protein